MTSTSHRSFARKVVVGVSAAVVGFGLSVVPASPSMAVTADCRLDFFQDAFTPPNTYRLALPCSPDVTEVWAIALYAEDFPFDGRRGGHYHPGDLVDRGILNEDDSV